MDFNEGEDLDLDAVVMLNNNEEISSLVCYYNEIEIAKTENSGFYLTSYANSLFQNRINAFKYNRTNYVIGINLLAIDSGTFKLSLVTMYMGQISKPLNSNSISIEVKADPVVLEFPSMVLGADNSTLTFNALVYGRPKPEIILKFEKEIIIAESSIDFPNNTFKYIYSFGAQFWSSPIKYCGKVFLLTLNGVKKQVKQAVPIFFVPPQVKVFLLKQYEDYSVFIQWKKIDLGICSLTYFIRFINSTYDVVQRFDGITDNEFSVTNPDNATLIRMYAIASGIVGSSVLLIVPPAAGKPQTSLTSSSNNWLLLGITFGSVAFLIIVCIIILVFVQLTLPPKKKYNQLHSSSSDIILEEISSSSGDLDTPLSSDDDIVSKKNKKKNPTLPNKLESPLLSNTIKGFSPVKTEFPPLTLPSAMKISSPVKMEIPPLTLPNTTKGFSPVKRETPPLSLPNALNISSPVKTETPPLTLPNTMKISSPVKRETPLLPLPNTIKVSSPVKTEILRLPLNQAPTLPL